MDHLVLDIETQRNPDDLPGKWLDTHLMGVSVAVVYDVERDRFQLYGPDDLKALRACLDAASRITTYNGWTFDLPVIYGLKRPAVVEHLAPANDDLLARIWKTLGTRVKGWSLGAVGLATLGRGKSGNGADAPRLYQEGRWIELINYCLEDVALLRDLMGHSEVCGELIGAGGQRVALPPWAPTT